MYLFDLYTGNKIVTNEVLERIGEKKTLLNDILSGKANWIDHILRRNCHFNDAIEGQVEEVKGVGRAKLIDYLRSRRRYWEIKEEAKDRKRWKRQFTTRI